MRTPTACSVNTPPKAPTSPDTPPRSSRRSLQRSTADHARRSTGARPPRRSTSIYDPFHCKPLRPPVEFAHEPRQVILRQPITRVRRHQERLLTIARQEVHSHALKCLNLLGRTPPVCATPTVHVDSVRFGGPPR